MTNKKKTYFMLNIFAFKYKFLLRVVPYSDTELNVRTISSFIKNIQCITIKIIVVQTTLGFQYDYTIFPEVSFMLDV